MNPSAPKGSTRTPVLHAAGALIGLACLAVSVQQGGAFVASLATTDATRIMLYVAAAALIGGGHLLARLIGEALRGGAPIWTVLLGGACMVLICLYSVLTSTNALTRHAAMRVQQETHASAEYRQAMTTVAAYRDQAEALRVSLAEVPATWLTKRGEMQDRINGVMARLERAQRAAGEITSSATGEALAAIAATTRMTPERLALLFAILLDLLPITIGLLSGYGPARRQEPAGATIDADADEEATEAPGKPRARLRAV